jgi:hypothetical protein
LYFTTASTLYEPEPGVNISGQSEQIALQNVYVILRQVGGLNLFGDIDLWSFKQSGAIEQLFDEFGESR